MIIVENLIPEIVQRDAKFKLNVQYVQPKLVILKDMNIQMIGVNLFIFLPLPRGGQGGVMKRLVNSYANKLFNSKANRAKRKLLRNTATNSEQKLWHFLKNRQLAGYRFRRQYGVGKFIVDFYCPEIKLAIEIDGANHFFDDKSTFYDLARQKFIENQGIKVLRFTNTEIINNIGGVIESIILAFKTSPNPSLERRGK